MNWQFLLISFLQRQKMVSSFFLSLVSELVAADSFASSWLQTHRHHLQIATPHVRLMFQDFTAVPDVSRRLFLLLLLLLQAAARSWILQVAQAGVNNPRATKFLKVPPSVCGYSVWNLLYVTLLAPSVFRLLLEVWRIYAPLGPDTVHTKIYVHEKYAVFFVTIFYLILSWI